MGIGLKLLFAALSGALVMLTWIMFFETDGWVGEVAFYGSCGALFAAGVLLPYVKSGHLRSWRTVAVFVVSGISFYAAVTAAIEWGSGRFGPNLEDYLVASLVGTAIVLLPAPYLLSLRYSLRFAVLGVIAALLGGWLFEVFEEWFAYSMFLSFALWHVVMCGALHWANPSAADDRWLANVGRRKLYGVASLFSLFIIVPLVDDAIGASLQYRYTANEGGIQVHEPVTAHGFRDRREEPVLFDTGCSFGCITLVNDRTYDFQEYVDDHPDHRFLLFFLARRPDPNCHAYDGNWKPPLGPSWTVGPKLDADLCLSYRIVDEPVARYEVRDERTSIDAGFGLYTLRKTHRSVIRLSDETVVAEASYFVFHSRLLGDSFGAVDAWPEFLEQALPPAGGEWQPPASSLDQPE